MDNTQIEVKLTEVDARAKSNTKRIDDIDERMKKQEELVNSVGILATEMKHFKTDLEEVKTDVKILVGKPGKLHDTITEKVILLVVGAIVTYLLMKGFGI